MILWKWHGPNTGTGVVAMQESGIPGPWGRAEGATAAPYNPFRGPEAK